MKQVIQLVALSLLMILQCSCNFSQDRKSEKISANWTKLPTTNFPLMRGEYALAYNSKYKKIVAYGGRTGFRSRTRFQNVNETWEFDYKKNTWVNLEAKNLPPWRANHSMVYDEVRNKVLMFGGGDFINAFNDLWQYDYSSNTWTNITPDYSPEARILHGMVYVPDRDVVIMYGGRKATGGVSFSDIWQLDCKTYTWKQLNPENNPGVADHVNITYDQSADKVLVYNTPAVWAYDFDSITWTKLESINNPILDHSSFMYETQYNKSVLFGNVEREGPSKMRIILYMFLILISIGLLSFLVCKSIQWFIPVNIKGKKSFWISYIAIATVQIAVVMLFINSKASNMERHTWIFDYSTISWTNITPRNMLGVRIEHDGMIYLEDEQVFIQYGGCCSDETLELKLDQ